MHERQTSRPAAFGFPGRGAGNSHYGATGANAAELVPLLETVARRWHWLLAGGATLAFLGFVAGLIFWKTSYTAPAQLIRYDSPNAEQVFGARQAAPETLPSILHSPELLQRVGAEANPPVSAEVLINNLRVMPEHDSDIIVVTLAGPDPKATVNLVNLYAGEAVRFTQEMQARAADEIIQFATQQLEQIEPRLIPRFDGHKTPHGRSGRPSSLRAPPRWSRNIRRRVTIWPTCSPATQTRTRLSRQNAPRSPPLKKNCRRTSP